MKNIFRLIAVAVCLSGIYSFAERAPVSPRAGTPEQFGRYFGVFQNKKTKREQLARLDFMYARDPEGSYPQIKSTLTLYLGDFSSPEYVSFHYEVGQYSEILGSLVFNNDEIPITLMTKKFNQNTLEAEVSGVWNDGEIGTLRLDRKTAPKINQEVLPPLGGNYEGQCDGAGTNLLLLTYRSSRNITGSGNAFSAYEIRGQTFSSRTSTITDTVLSGSYDFFNDELILNTRRGKAECNVGPSGLSCKGPLGKCEFKRSPYTAKVLVPPQASPAFPMETSGGKQPPPLEGGTYIGYIHHEFLNRYQLGRLTLTTYPWENQGARIVPTGEMVFGSNETFPETIPIKFEETIYPAPFGSDQVLMLSNPKTDMDVLVQVRSYAKGVLRGIWFSNIFGRVGTFEFRKKELGRPLLPRDAKMIEKLSGDYRADNVLLNISVRRDNTPLNTANPFAPNVIEGATMVEDLTYPHPLSGGSYDFYTGRIALESEAAGYPSGSLGGAPRATQVYVGTRYSGDHLSLFYSSGIFGGICDFVPWEFKLRQKNKL